MTNSQWVLLLHFFARHFYQSCWIPWPTVSEGYCFIFLPGIHINHVASHDQQLVSHTASFLHQAVWSIMLDPMTTASEWDSFICLSHSLINHVVLHEHQQVSDTASPRLVCQAFSSIMLHPMTNSKWVLLLHLFARHFHQSCCIPWLTASEWHCFICLPGSLINHIGSHDQQFVSDTTSFIHQAFSSIMLHAMTNRKWVTLLHLSGRHSHQSLVASHD